MGNYTGVLEMAQKVMEGGVHNFLRKIRETEQLEF